MLVTDVNPAVFSARLRARRMALGLSQTEAAAKLQINQTQYARYENGKTTPSLEVATRIAVTLSISLDWLIGISDYVQRSVSLPDPQLQERLLAAFRDQDIKTLLHIILEDMNSREQK